MMKKKPSYPVSFRVYPWKKYYYTVHIFEDLRQMRTFWREQCRVWKVPRRVVNDKFLGQCNYWYSPYDRFNCGQVLLCNTHLGAGIISHEMVHAATFFLHDRKNIWDFRGDENNEILAHMLGDLVRQFWVKWYKIFS